MTARRVAVDSVLVTALNTVAQIASFVLFAAIARSYGADVLTDAFFLALTVPMLLIGPVVNAIRAVFVPIIAECRTRQPEAQGRLVGSTVLYVALISLAGTALFAIAAPFILPLAAKGLPVDARPLVVRLTIMLLPMIVAQTVGAVLAASYNAAGRFTLPAVAAALRHVAALVVIVSAADRWGVMALPAGFVAGALFQVILLLASWPALGVRIEWTLRISDELRRSLRLAVPLILGTIALYLSILVTRYLASWLPAGSVTILDYASRITSAVMEVLTSGVLLVILSSWSNLLHRASSRVLHLRVRQTIVLVLFAVLPVLAILFAARLPAVTVLLSRGEFDPSLARATASVFAILLLGLPLDIVGRIFTRLFLVRQVTWVMGTAAAIRLGLVTVIALALMGEFGLHGLAVAESVGLAATTVFFAWILHRTEPGSRLLSEVAMPVMRIAALSGCAGIVAALVSQLLDPAGALPSLIGATVAGAATYVGLAFLARAGELRAFVELFSRRLEPLR